jgi:microcystin-dependent protein
MLKKIITLILLAVFFSSAFAQTKKLPVQGKLFENNLTVNGTRNLGFSIAAIGWNQTLNNVAVSEGLYAVELDVPADLFATQVAHDLSINVNGTPLSTVKIHPPIESDPTVPASLKDGVSWNEVTNKPATIDLDPTNELQTLSLTGTTLSISGGNEVNLPTGGGSGAGIFDTLLVGPPKLAIVTSPSVLSGSQAEFKSSVNQTFIAESAGRLVSIELFCANSQDAGISFIVRRIGNGQQIASNSFPNAAFSATLGYQKFTPSQPDPKLNQYEQYVIEVTVTGGASYLFGYDPGDPYKFGQSNIVPGNDADLRFKVNIEKTVGPSMQIDSNGMVGIGLSNPTAALHVNGRIKDKTGFLVPVGTIFSYAGTVAPEGWLLCDGSAVSRVVYSDLFQAIGTNWSAGVVVDADKFRLPELQGQFLRGVTVDGLTNTDPDFASRQVGSYQDDALQGHRHEVKYAGVNIGNGSVNANGQGERIGTQLTSTVNLYAENLVALSTYGTPRVSSETRPANSAVLYIIKY